MIDGTYELFRAHYGAPSSRGQDGKEKGATRALARSLRALLRSGAFSHYGIAFDSVIESFRNELFAGYKTGEGIEPELLAQFPLAEQAAEEAGFFVWKMVEFEADDALASAAQRFASHPDLEEVIVASPDKDLMQTVRAGVRCWDRMRDKYYDEAAVFEKFGVRPSSIPDYLALVGDSADGIPGVPKWGAKSAAKLLEHYGRVEEIPLDAGRWGIKVRGAVGLAEQLERFREEVPLFKQLATLRTDVELHCDLEDLASSHRV